MNNKFNAIIIDDERPARLMISSLLKKHDQTINLIGEAKNGKEALTLIEELKPDLIFLDIQMPDMNGFEVLAGLKQQPMVVFVTAYDQYALNAFKENSIDYLLKPVEEERFDQCIQKLITLGKTINENEIKTLAHLFSQLQPKKEITAIPVKVGQKILLIKLNDIAYCQSSDGYVSLYTNAGKEYISDFCLHDLEEKLPDYFIRVQKSYIVNKNHIKEIQRYFNNRLILILDDKDNTRVTTGTSYILQIRKELGLSHSI